MGTQREPDRSGESPGIASAASSARAPVPARAEDTLYPIVAILLAALALTVIIFHAAAFIR